MNARQKELATQIYEFVASIAQEKEKAEDVVTACVVSATLIARDCGFTQEELRKYVEYLFTIPLPPIEEDNDRRN